MSKTNLFLIGAAKAGTTALAEMLGNHPQISPLAIKEPGHFCDDIYANGFSASYQKMLRWDEGQYFKADALDQRHMAFVQGRENYDRLVSEATDAQYILDASTAYLPSVNAAVSIADYNSEAKIIVSLRNPATRAYSHYNMARKYGKEQRSFLEAIKSEGALERARWGWDECYLELGNYAPQLERWLKHFTMNQIHVVWQDELLAEPAATLQGILKFLGLKEELKPLAEEKHGAEVPKNKVVGKVLGGIGPAVAAILPKKIKAGVKNIVLAKPEGMEEAARSFLLRYFAPSIEALEKLLEKDLTHWK
jgi:hypothetical protein